MAEIKQIETCITCGNKAVTCSCGDFISDRPLTTPEKIRLLSESIAESAAYLVGTYTEPYSQNIFGEPVMFDRPKVAQRMRGLINELSEVLSQI